MLDFREDHHDRRFFCHADPDGLHGRRRHGPTAGWRGVAARAGAGRAVDAAVRDVSSNHARADRAVRRFRRQHWSLVGRGRLQESAEDRSPCDQRLAGDLAGRHADRHVGRRQSDPVLEPRRHAPRRADERARRADPQDRVFARRKNVGLGRLGQDGPAMERGRGPRRAGTVLGPYRLGSCGGVFARRQDRCLEQRRSHHSLVECRRHAARGALNSRQGLG